jgi:hypothetical protein
LTDYSHFLQRKARVWTGRGVDTRSAELPPQLYDWQAACTKWALRKGRAALFEDCGLGKSFQQCAWANAIPGRVLMLAPLCVAEQTVGEAAKLGLDVHYAVNQDAAEGHRLVITNYERLDNFDASAFAGVVLDESSILKAFDGKTRTKLIDTFRETPYRLCCTATPAPNDIAELANHAEFLGLMTRPEFLATWFVHDDEGWRMKKHAVQPFYRWLASWALALRKPSDIGYPDDRFILPALRIHDRIVDSENTGGTLFAELGMKGIGGRLKARKGSLEARVDAAANIIDEYGVTWLAWCGLNDESRLLAEAVPGMIEVCGSDSYAKKVGAVNSFVSGETRKLASKIRILGYGMNFQHCSHMLFLGIGDSFEQYYQGIRRCWRFGQTKPVDVHIVVSEAEQLVVENVRRKEATHDALGSELLAHMRDFEKEEIEAVA